jgi:hypothetical protein
MKPNKKALDDLELLFKFAPPQELKKSLTYLLMQFLILNPPEKQPRKELYENIYFLMDFLDKVEEE